MLAPDSLESLVCALHFGLVFQDEDGFLRGWIEPTNADPSVWDLHLMPGELYPPGHGPSRAPTPASAPGPRAGELVVGMRMRR